jgi:hypothetical protein
MLFGCNFIPSTAINQLECGRKKLSIRNNRHRIGYAEKPIQYNACILHYLVWYQDPKIFMNEWKNILTIAQRHNISTMFVFFDDCWNSSPKLGKQPEPKPRVQIPAGFNARSRRVTDLTKYPILEKLCTSNSLTFLK